MILVLQVPFLISLINEPDAPVGPSTAIAGLTNPQAFRPWLAYDSVTGITGNLLLPLDNVPLVFAITTLVAMAIVSVVYRRDLILLGASVGAIVMATLLFVTSTRSYDGYWFLTLTTAVTLTVRHGDRRDSVEDGGQVDRASRRCCWSPGGNPRASKTRSASSSTRSTTPWRAARAS